MYKVCVELVVVTIAAAVFISKVLLVDPVIRALPVHGVVKA